VERASARQRRPGRDVRDRCGQAMMQRHADAEEWIHAHADGGELTRGSASPTASAERSSGLVRGLRPTCDV
jgi:hypothetical protein